MGAVGLVAGEEVVAEVEVLAEDDGLVEAEPLADGEVLTCELLGDALLWVGLGAELVADAEVLVTGGTTAAGPPPRERLDTGETAVEE